MKELSEGPVRLHSARDPHKEALRYVLSLSELTGSRVIVVTEPGESFLAHALRQQCPYARIVAVRYGRTLFRDTDSLWDSVWRPGSSVSLSSFLFALLPEDILPQVSFVPWKPSDERWPTEASEIWRELAVVIRTQRSVLQTRAYFGPRWLSNSIKNAILATNIVEDAPIRVPAILAASGPTLERFFPFQERNSFFFIALSSAVTAILSHGITPDLCVTTDGGYWATFHIANIPPDVPLAFPLEAAVPARVLSANPLLLFDYGSPVESALFSLSGIHGATTEQSGTVAGTAALYALSRSDCEVFAAGLDLSPGAARAHCAPHAFDGIVDAAGTRLSPLCQTLFERNSSSAALEIYARWFSERKGDFSRRFFRINPAQNNLGNIQEADVAMVKRAARASTAPEGKPAYEKKQKSKSLGQISEWLMECSEALRNRELSRNVANYALQGMGLTRDETVKTGNEAVLANLLQLVSFRDYLSLLRRDPDQFEIPESVSRDLTSLARRARALEVGTS